MKLAITIRVSPDSGIDMDLVWEAERLGYEAGWHGVPFGKPLLRTREYIAIIRQVLERKAPLEYRGEHYQIPYMGPGASGLGKPLRSIIHGDPGLKIYTAAIAPAG